MDNQNQEPLFAEDIWPTEEEFERDRKWLPESMSCWHLANRNLPGLVMFYAQKRLDFMREERFEAAKQMLWDGSLCDYLLEVGETAMEMREQIVERRARKDPPPSKETDPMGWVQHMNLLEAEANDFVLREIVYQ